MHKKSSVQLFALVAAATMVAAGCVSKKAAKAPSSELIGEVGGQTAELVTDIQFNLHLADSIELMQYLDGKHPRLDEYTLAWEEMNDTLDVVVDYSLSLIDLAEESQPSNQVAIESLISILVDFESRLQKIPGVQKHLGADSIVTLAPAMREQKTMLKAFKVAGPVVQEYSDAIQQVTLDVDTKFDAAVEEMLAKIDERHGKMLDFRANLIDRQNLAIDGLQQIDAATKGDEAAWRELLATNWNVSSAIGKGAGLNSTNVRKADQILTDQLKSVNEVREQLLLPYAAYINQMTELYKIVEQSDQVHKLAFLLAADWAASQKLLAQGDPSLFKRASSTMWKAAQKRITG